MCTVKTTLHLDALPQGEKYTPDQTLAKTLPTHRERVVCAHKNFLSEELIRLSRLVTTSFTGRTQTSQDERGPSTQPSVQIKRSGRRGAVHRAFCWRENGSINSARKIGSLLPLFSSTIQLQNRTFVTVSVHAWFLSMVLCKTLRDP